MAEDIDAQRQYYDERWGKEHFANPMERERAALFVRLFARTELRDPRILDLGCGRGWLAGMLSSFGPTTAVDLSPKGIERAQERWPDVEFRAGNFFEMDLEEGAFDVVVSQEVIEHVEDQAGYIELARKCLKPGGYLLLTTPNNAVQKRRSKELIESWQLQPTEKWLDRAGLAALAEPSFEILGSGTLLPGHGNRGILMVLDSPKLRTALGWVGLAGLWDSARCRAGLGLHLWLMARAR
ncbi:MAG: class I SAM-dependent methyltransferase [Planctomycetota bacterium]|jgi:2-polyprenyl-3-methyl-5-hydroxy-6-metoxy-1,4-benzoquinol methylase